MLVVQIRAIWGIWDRDLDGGDTASYFSYADQWVESLAVDMAWSPLYTAYLGTANLFTDSPATAEQAHRAFVVLAVAVLLLALLRRLLPPWAALAGALWWAVNPIVFATKDTIHLFAAIPLLLAALLLTDEPGPWRKGAAVGVLLLSTVAVRNEAVAVLALLIAAFAVAAWRRRAGPGEEAGSGAGVGDRPSRRLALGLGVPVVLALLVIGFLYQRADAGDTPQDSFDAKHSLNVCQAYRVNLNQREPGTVGDRDCPELMADVFGEPSPGLLGAWLSNPGEMTEFAAWNVRLLPAGVQLALFSSAAGDTNPGYEQATLGRWQPAVLLVAVLALLITGALLLRRDSARWRAQLHRQRWAWIALAAIALGALAVIVFGQRPRPAYMFGLTAGLLAAIWLAVAVIARRLGIERWAAAGAAILPLVLLLVIPTRFGVAPTPVNNAYERLRPLINQPADFPGDEPVLGARGWAPNLCDYLLPSEPCRGVNLGPNPDSRAGAGGLETLLDENGVTVVYVDEGGAGDPELNGLARSDEWRRLASGRGAGGPWAILARAPQQEGPAEPAQSG
ncbi:MAG TPA: hypothetical protein VKA36_10990 [Solirubrobacterales bacterium]|nr:hypothetical protein [Solirubrobacterales bacterium]